MKSIIDFIIDIIIKFEAIYMSDSERVKFVSKSGLELDGVLEKADGESYALYAHCFTCTKEIKAAITVARQLAKNGVSVLRFDFAGLGKSGGDFSDTSFSTNVDDLKAAAKYLEENYKAPNLIIGHSLGGAAVLAAANDMPSIKAVATIAAPYEPKHVQHLFESEVEKIRAQGEAEVDLVGRKFVITKNFVDDLETYDLSKTLPNMKKPLLVMHSPTDQTVGVENAKSIFDAAQHPKSFVSLDGAEHLLGKKADAEFAANIISSWSQRYTG